MPKSKIEEAVENAIAYRVKDSMYKFFRTATTVCITATLAMTGLLYNFGVYLYTNSEATKAAIDTFIEVKKLHDKI